MNAAACVVSSSRDVGVDLLHGQNFYIEYEGANPLMGVRQRPIPEQAEMASSNVLLTHMPRWDGGQRKSTSIIFVKAAR